jgi:MFS family permease
MLSTPSWLSLPSPGAGLVYLPHMCIEQYGRSASFLVVKGSCILLGPDMQVTKVAYGGRRRERARAVTTVFGSLDVGSAVGLLTCGPLIRAYGWPSVFYLFAIAGLAWCMAWPLFKPEKPALITSPEAAAKAGAVSQQSSSSPPIYLCLPTCSDVAIRKVCDLVGYSYNLLP